jgi:transposase
MKKFIEFVAAIGIDLGDKTAYFACLNDQGDLVMKDSVPMTAAAFKKTFGFFKPTRIAIEAGAQSRWVACLLEALGHQVIIANPRQLKLISASASKNDQNDAVLLARLARVDPSLLSPLKHRPEQEQTQLLAIRARAQLVDTRTGLIHSLRGMLKTFGIRLPGSTSAYFAEHCQASVPPPFRPLLEGTFKVIAELSRQIEAYDEQVEQMAREQHPEVARLCKISGVGTLTALTYVLTLADPKRFAHSRDVGPYLGLRPRQQQSGSQNPQLGISKAGDSYLRRLLVQCAHSVMRRHAPDTALRVWGLRLCERGGKNAKKRAIVAVARKLAILMHRLWAGGGEYQPFPA